MVKRIGLIGASCRAMAASLVRGGFSVCAADMFADGDLAQLGDVKQLRSYPWSAPRWLRQADVDAWCYTGGLENYPRLIERVAAEKRLLGNSPITLRKVRDPFWLADLAKRHGFPFPETCRVHDPAYDPMDPRPSDQWLLKPYRSAGGLNIQPVSSLPELAHRFYLQRKMPGMPMSAVVLSTRDACRVVGVSRLMIGQEYGAPGPFVFAGASSTYPLKSEGIQPIADAIRDEAGLIGLWGFDFLQSDVPLLLEVNPRWTATMALHERMRNDGLMKHHLQACLHQEIDLLPQYALGVSGMRILYAKKRLRVTDDMLDRMDEVFGFRHPLALLAPSIGDIPTAGTTIETGHPVCTLYVDRSEESQIEPGLAESEAKLNEILYAEDV
ncbi:ATP-grasp domain-containing protein [Bremerella sp. JC770]|uniref:ATP-grasp domain-containing protein n=1 Tax=Bremerella sp. JC770 TaxID=3232137 RepID=UPI003457656F